jgi:GAF domain-containing protein
MHSFLGVPIKIRGEAWGNLYLTEKHGGAKFDEADEQAVVILADWAAIAIENAYLYEAAEMRRAELERAVRGLEATQAVAVAIGAETDLDRILELIVKRGRALFDAHSIVILLQEGDDLVVAARSGRATLARGLRIPLRDSILGEVLAAGRTERVADVCPLAPTKPDASDAQNALVLPLVHRGQRLGVLTVFDGAHEASLDEEQELVLRAFAASAATAVATGWSQPRPSAGAGRVSSTMRHFKRWAGCGSCSPRPCGATRRR